ncbi:MAG TPA: SusC/RagA family TonB-linked outer membrane protein [Ferruginibacter sp.]|nr:SusC/RagA family TonB-linked outer membrane protein [Ferruginibacter sp.]
MHLKALCTRRKRVLTKTCLPVRQALLVMKLSVILILAFTLQVSATGYSQKITLSVKETSLEKIFREIEKQTGYYFAYTSELLQSAKPISIDVKDASLKDVLDQCIKGQPLSYTIIDKVISVKKAVVTTSPVILNESEGSPPVNVWGKVVNDKGEPVIATVTVKGTKRSTSTDVNGFFSLKNINENSILVLTSVSIAEPVELAVSSFAPDELKIVTVKSRVTTGEDIVINTGYQKLKLNEVTGSVTHITNELFNRRIGATVLERIIDLVPGFFQDGDVNATGLSRISIRGISTINASKYPLIILDNYIFEGDLNLLNPNDIESVTILKDAAAASIWGARAGNGVIVITSKKGKMNSAPTISFNTNITIGEKPKLFPLPAVSSIDAITLERKRFAGGYYDGALADVFLYPFLSPVVEILAKQRSGALSADEANKQIAFYENHDVRNDINKYLLQTFFAQQYALSVSGGGNNHQYYGSIGYDRNRPNNINIRNERITILLNSTWTPIKNLQITAGLDWGQAMEKDNNGFGYESALARGPYLHLADNEGNALSIPYEFRLPYVDSVKFPGQLDWHFRPLDEAGNANTYRKSLNNRINGGLTYTIAKSFLINFGYNWQRSSTEETEINSTNTFLTRNLINKYTTIDINGQPVYPIPLGGIYKEDNSEQTSFVVRGSLSFNRRFNLHEFSSLVGFERSQTNRETRGLPDQYGYNPEIKTFQFPMYGNRVTRPGNGIGVISAVLPSLRNILTRFGSQYGNLSYIYKKRYSFTASGRIDESNFFGVDANDRKKPLWSVGVNWKIDKEKFYTYSLIPKLALRVSYGYNGNTSPGTSPLATAAYYNGFDPTYLTYASISTPPNPELTWEQIRVINIGIDFQSIKSIVTGNLDFYQRRSTDLISPVTVDPTSGFNQYMGNSSSLQTNGVDLTMTARIKDGLFKWYTTINFAFQHDKVISYSVQNPKNGQFQGVFVGKPLSGIYSYNWAGLNPLNGNSLFYLGNHQIVEASSATVNNRVQGDLVYSGQTRPTVFGSFRNDLSFRNFTFSANISYEFGHVFRRNTFGGQALSWIHEDYLKAWKQPGDELFTNVPGFEDIPTTGGRYSVYTQSNILIEKGDHIRLRDIKLDYHFQRNTNKKNLFNSMSIYAYVSQLGFMWKASKYNPDTQNSELRTSLNKTFSFGLNLIF